MNKLEFPSPLSFYILLDTIFVNTENEGIPHPELWKKVVMKTFSGLAYENKQDLFNHCYGLDRGRVVHHPEDNSWTLYGTPGCELFQDQLIQAFGLSLASVQTDFRTDLHYKTVKADVVAVEYSMKLAKIAVNEGIRLEKLLRL